MAEDLNLDNLAGTVSWDHPAEYSKVLVGLPNPERKVCRADFVSKCAERDIFPLLLFEKHFVARSERNGPGGISLFLY